MNPAVSILTPTYNRARTLGRLYESICRASPDVQLEWVVIDDGSEDDTPRLMEQWSAENKVRLKYLRKENGGRHTAINAGVPFCEGTYTVVMDSDDWLVPDGLERLVAAWSTFAHRPDYGAVAGNCIDQHGNLIGTPFPGDLESDFVEIRAVYNVKGDKKELFRTDVLRAFPFPEFGREKRVPFSLMLGRIAKDYHCYFMNVDVCSKEYRSDGLSANLDPIRIASANGSRARYAEYAALSSVPVLYRLRNASNFVRFSFHAKQSFLNTEANLPAWLLTVALPIGIVAFLTDRIRSLSGKHVRRTTAAEARSGAFKNE